VPDHPVPGRSLATSQAMVDLVRSSTVGSYGVTGFAERPLDRPLGRAGLARPGIAVRPTGHRARQRDLVDRGADVA
jgi:hypothetical protein